MRNFSWLLSEGDVTMKVGLERDWTFLALKMGRGQWVGMQAAPQKLEYTRQCFPVRAFRKEHSLDDTLILVQEDLCETSQQ